MKPITSIEATTKNKNSITIRLGDIFTIASGLKVINPETTDHFTPLILLTAAITQDLVRKSYSRIYFTMVGADKMSYTIARTTEGGIVLINYKGKESEIREKHLVEAIHRFKSGGASIMAGGIRLYICTAISRLRDIRDTDIHRLEARAMDLSKWPSSALILWARNHLGIPGQHVPGAKYVDDKTALINSMIRMSVTLSANAPKLPKSKHVEVGDQGIYRAFRSGGITGRRGNVGGITFLNLNEGEIAAHQPGNNRILIYTKSDVKMNDLEFYMVIFINTVPMWIIVPQTDRYDASITWGFREDESLIIYVKMFTEANVHWLAGKLADKIRKYRETVEISDEGTSPEPERAPVFGDSVESGRHIRKKVFNPDTREYSCVIEPNPYIYGTANINMSEAEIRAFKWSNVSIPPPDRANDAPAPDPHSNDLVWYNELNVSNDQPSEEEEEEW